MQALWLAVVFALSVVVPVRQAQAVVPLVGIAVAALGPGGTLVTADLLTAGVSSLIGGAIVALAITPSTADAPVRVPLVSDKPTIDAAMPPPAASATTAGTQQSAGAACGAVLALLGTTSTPNGCSVTTTYSSNGVSSYAGGYYNCGYNRTTSTTTPGCESTYNRTYTNDGTYSYYQASPNMVCPAGYTQSGATCNLSDPRATASDGKADLNRTASGFQTNSTEKDSVPAYANVTNNKVYASGKDSSGRPVMIEYAVSADGTKTYVTHYTQMEDSTQSTVKTQTLTIDAATGAVTSAGASTAVGSVSPATSAGSVPTVTTGAAVTSGAGTSQQSLTLPTDYARTGEAASAASSINTKLDTLHKDLTEKGADVADPVLPEAAAFSSAFFNGTFGDLLAWRLPSHTSECSTITLDYMMFSSHQVHVMDAQCTIAEQVRPVLSVVMIVVWTVVALFVLLGA